MNYEEKVHERLPALYFALGVIFVLGATYIGIGHEFTVGYAMIGVSCMIAGAFKAIIHRKRRATPVRTQR